MPIRQSVTATQYNTTQHNSLIQTGRHVEVNLEKFVEKWWDGVLEGDAEIDRTTIDTTQHVHDFDEQTQGDIRKVRLAPLVNISISKGFIY